MCRILPPAGVFLDDVRDALVLLMDMIDGTDPHKLTMIGSCLLNDGTFSSVPEVSSGLDKRVLRAATIVADTLLDHFAFDGIRSGIFLPTEVLA